MASAGPALAETPAAPDGVEIPAILEADLSATEKQKLAATTSGDGVPLSALVTTPDGPQIVTLDADSRADAVAAAALLDAQPSVQAANVSIVMRPAGGTYPQYGNEMMRSVAARADVDNPLSDVVVAVLDTGVSPHAELTGALLPGQNFTDSLGGAGDVTDRVGHGTHVAGTVAADAGSEVEGIAYGARVLPVKVLGDDGAGLDSWISDGILWAADNGADVINMSLGGPGYSSVMESAIAYARSRGVTVIAAAGNSDSPDMFSPAGLAGVVAVSAVDEARAKASFSNYGPSIDVAAPGVRILSTLNDGGFAEASGTSMASPHVAGVAALVKGAAPGLTPDQVERALVWSAIDLGAPGRDDQFGYGLVDAPRAVSAANSLEGTGSLPAGAGPITVPRSPAMATPSLASGTVRVKWAPPSVDGGSAVTGYTVRVYRGTTLLTTTTTSATARDLRVSGLTNGTTYTFTVGAKNIAGPGPVATVKATPRTKPSAPRVTATAARSAVKVYWAAPSNGGAPITSYLIRAYRGTTHLKTVRMSATARSLVITSVVPGVEYRFTVAAVNAAGEGARSASAYAVPLR